MGTGTLSAQEAAAVSPGSTLFHRSAHRIIPGDTLPAWAVVRESPLDVEALTWAIQRTWRHIKRHAWSALLAGFPGAPHTTPPAHPLTCTVPLPEAFGRSAEEAHAAELADALRRRRAFLEARAASQAQSGQLSMQERVDIAEVLARSASGQASAALARLRSLDEATLRGFAHGYVGVVRECLDEFLAGYADAKHAQVREWMARHPAEVASFRQRQAEQGVVIEEGEGLPPASTPSGARGPTLRIGGTALDMSSSAVQARLGTGQAAASAGMGRAAAAMQALGQGLDAVAARHGGSAAAQAAQALQGAAGSLAGWGQRLGQGDARHVAERAEQTVAALQGASEAVRGDGGAQFAQQAHAATSPLRQAASARAAAAYAALRTSVVAGNPAALQAAASSAGQEVAQAGQAAVGAARRSSLGRSAVQFVREAAGAWGQSDHAEPARPVGLHGWEGGPGGAAGQRGGQYDPVEWALDAMGTTNAAVREAVRERLAKEGKGDGVPSTPPPPDKA